MAKDARIYEELAAIVRGWGYSDASGVVLHDWRKRGLLLPLGRRGVDHISPAALERLRRVCDYRYRDGVRDLRLIAALLWLDGDAISTSAARAGLLKFLDRLELPVRRRLAPGLRGRQLVARNEDDSAVDFAVDDAANAMVDNETLAWGEPVDTEGLRDGFAELLRGLLGVRSPRDLDPAALEPAARFLGLYRAQSESLPGVDPWLADDPATALARVLERINVPELRAAVSGAPDSDLERARALAARLTSAVPPVAAALTLGYGAGAFGLRALTGLSGVARLNLVLTALLVPARMEEVTRVLEAQHTEMEAALVLADRYLGEHPELRAEIERRGLVAVLQDLAASTSPEQLSINAG